MKLSIVLSKLGFVGFSVFSMASSASFLHADGATVLNTPTTSTPTTTAVESSQTTQSDLPSTTATQSPVVPTSDSSLMEGSSLSTGLKKPAAVYEELTEQAEIEILRRNIDAWEAKVERLSNEVNNSEAELEPKLLQRNEYRTRLNTLTLQFNNNQKLTRKEKDGIIKEIFDLENKINALNAEINALKISIKQKLNDIKDFKAQITKARQRLYELTGSYYTD